MKKWYKEFSVIGGKLHVIAKYKYHNIHLITKTASVYLPSIKRLNFKLNKKVQLREYLYAWCSFFSSFYQLMHSLGQNRFYLLNLHKLFWISLELKMHASLKKRERGREIMLLNVSWSAFPVLLACKYKWHRLSDYGPWVLHTWTAFASSC